MIDITSEASPAPVTCEVAAPMRIASLAELERRQDEILHRFEAIAHAGNLFMINPFLLLADAGVDLSTTARQEILATRPELAAVSETAYRALRASRSPQRFRVRLHGLFNPRTST